MPGATQSSTGFFGQSGGLAYASEPWGFAQISVSLVLWWHRASFYGSAPGAYHPLSASQRPRRSGRLAGSARSRWAVTRIEQLLADPRSVMVANVHWPLVSPATPRGSGRVRSLRMLFLEGQMLPCPLRVQATTQFPLLRETPGGRFLGQRLQFNVNTPAKAMCALGRIDHQYPERTPSGEPQPPTCQNANGHSVFSASSHQPPQSSPTG